MSPETVETVFLIDGPENGNPFGIDGHLGPLSLHAKRLELDFAIELAVIIWPWC